MTKAYLLAYSADFGDRERVKAIINSTGMVDKWRTDLPNAFYLISQYSAKQLVDQMRAASGDKGRFIVTEIPSNSHGWLTGDSWYLIQNHAYKPK